MYTVYTYMHMRQEAPSRLRGFDKSQGSPESETHPGQTDEVLSPSLPICNIT